ncbi:reactive mitochondrial oxygen species modulator 1-domain-containing protein [Obelidium mucronatum]|nr:reactive mitochondrial oxygen species modulator 1-domain-containing protein [Obelidium mucronatum]
MSLLSSENFQKMKMGFLMGGTTGACLGFLVGGMTVLRYGPGDKGYLATVGNQMLQTGGFLGFIMSIGMVVRADGVEPVSPFVKQQRPLGAYWPSQNRLPIVIEKLK